MNVSAISSNDNTNFKASFNRKNAVYRNLRRTPFYNKNNSEKTTELFQQLSKIGKGQKLDIIAPVDFTYLHIHESGIKVINRANGKERVYTDSVEKPFWDKILVQILADKAFFE